MKKIGLFNLDSNKFPNLALYKIEQFYKNKGYEVIWNERIKIPECEEIFVSCIFSDKKKDCIYFEELRDRLPDVKIHIGGTGYDIDSKLPQEIENQKIHKNFGFTSRGCIRKCQFCVVPQKEGMWHSIGDIYDIWDGKSQEIILMDNNIFSNFEHFKKISEQLIENNLKVDFNQGLDIRLLTDDFAKILQKISPISTWRFAFDSPRYTKPFIRGADILKKYELLSRSQVYVLCGFDTTIHEDIERMRIISEYHLNAYFMLYDKGRKLKGELTQEEIDILEKVRAPSFVKEKYLKILNQNNRGITKRFEDNTIYKKLF
jgi:hypothetical protein